MIAVVGAGLAGLRCAQELHRRGREFLVFEAETEPGGRVRSRSLDGFVLDCGFQVILSSYAAVKDAVDIFSLRPRRFASGALLARGSNLTRLESPIADLHAFISGATTNVFSFADKLRLVGVLAGVLRTPDSELLARCGLADDTSVVNWLAGRGFGDGFTERFVRPFFGGVLLDNELETSAALFLYYLKKFALGHAWIPAAGIGALPAAMAAELPPASLRYGRRVVGWVRSQGQVTALLFDDGSQVDVSAVVLALDEPSLRNLEGEAKVSGRTVAVAYFKTQRSLYDGRFLVLPEGRNRLVRHFAQVTNIAPELAPPGWHLVSASILTTRSPNDLASSAAQEIAEIFPASQGTLTHLTTIHVPYAVPTQPPGFAARIAAPEIGSNVVLAGDWRAGASIQAALESGVNAAKIICQ